MQDIIFQNIKNIIQGFLPGAKVMVFGSRARGEDSAGSDYDVLIITQSSLPPREKITWCSKIDKALVQSIHAPVDVLINSEKEISDKRQLPGHIIRRAMQEGILL